MSPTSERLAPASPAMPDDAPVMVHVASRVTEEVFSFLGPATAALKSEGITPMLVTLDDPAARVWLERFDPSVRLVLVPPSWQPLGDQVRLRAAAVRAVRRCRRLEGVHFHGVIPRVLGASVIKAVGPRTPVFFSPHGSRLLGSLSLGGRVVLRFTGWQRGGAGQRTIASHKVDQQRLSAVVDARVNLIESPVPGVFLDIARREAAAPIIIGGSQTAADDEAVEMFTRFAVLLRDTAREAAFCWIGPVSDAQRKLLGTVSATIVPRDDEIERARWLARAWIYLASGGGRAQRRLPGMVLFDLFLDRWLMRAGIGRKQVVLHRFRDFAAHDHRRAAASRADFDDRLQLGGYGQYRSAWNRQHAIR